MWFVMMGHRFTAAEALREPFHELALFCFMYMNENIALKREGVYLYTMHAGFAFEKMNSAECVALSPWEIGVLII